VVKILLKASAILLMACGCAQAIAANVQAPSGAIQQGSLANPKLQQQATPALIQEVATLGCQKPEGYHPFVMKAPEGAVGARTWEEQWIVDGCGKTFPVTIDFSEEGGNAANFQIVAPNQ
jgi:hypothetical protein